MSTNTNKSLTNNTSSTLKFKCDHCRRKKMTIKCNYCDNDYCASCIQLETHKCEHVAKYIECRKEVLEKQLTSSTPDDKWIEYESGNAY